MSLKADLITKIAKHERIRFLAKFLKNFNNMEFIKDVNNLYNSRTLYKITQKGNKEKGKVLYLINEKYAYYGFCAILREVIEGCMVADELGFYPVVSMSEDSLYAEKKGFLGKDNPWECYFEQPVGIDMNIYNQGFRTTLMSRDDLAMIAERYNNDGYRLSKDYFSETAKIWRKYIKIRKELEIELQSKINEVFCKGARILGVQARGTDFNQGYYNHPKPILPKDYFEQIDKVIEKYDYIFLATEDNNNLEKFIARYGSKLIYHKDILRSSTFDNPVLVRNDSYAERENPKYSLAKDVMLDMMSLSQCTGIITGMSQVSICARIWKFAKNECFEDDTIMDKGVFSDKKNSVSISKLVKNTGVKFGGW
ncbi:hypothetical protein [Peptoanaerobacter stomatis]|uniref:hypothetical protein n=1 Tax=Peptoanaerobacter stomatis TaxID=796937 RepID=UPI003F9FE918